MRNNLLLLLALFTGSWSGFAQINKDQLSLEVSKADAENTEKLKAYIWKLHADILGEGGNKTTLVSEFKYDKNGDLAITVIGGATNIDPKRGIRGRVQQSAIKNKLEYVGQALEYSLAYTYMTKGQLLDFFNKAELTEKDGILTARASNVYLEGDQLTIRMDAKSKFFLSKSFSTKLGTTSINGEVQYETFKSSGVNHISTTKLDLPEEKITIKGENKDYTIRVD